MKKDTLKYHGFTLLEILIALFIFTIVAVMMTHALHNILLSQQATEQHAERLTKLQFALLLLSHDLEQTVDRSITNAKDEEEFAFIGSPNTITFTHGGLVNPGGQLQRSTLQRTRYQLANHQFIRETWPVLDQAPTTQPSQRVLLSAVSKIHFRYLDQQGHLNDKWPPPEQSKQVQIMLPRAVQVVITVANWGKISQFYLIPGQSLDKH